MIELDRPFETNTARETAPELAADQEVATT
jgi:hypothetical protein